MKTVPAFSQYLDITDQEWKVRSCGPVCVAMLLGYYGKPFPSLDKIVETGRELGAHSFEVGWYHSGLVRLGQHFGLEGKAYDWKQESDEKALDLLEEELSHGPLIASIHKDFDQTQGGHLIVLTRQTKEGFEYSEPASEKREYIHRTITKEKFKQGWKKRIIVLRP